MKQFWIQFAVEDDCQDLIEYGLLAGLISILAVVAITAVGNKLNGHYQNVQAAIP
jgi:Flp pilus assembly pilin Flp